MHSTQQPSDQLQYLTVTVLNIQFITIISLKQTKKVEIFTIKIHSLRKYILRLNLFFDWLKNLMAQSRVWVLMTS